MSATVVESQKPVVVYAASGYTGRLACQALTRLGVPFVAGGRSQQRLEEVVRELRAGGADCVARAAEHTPAGLRGLFRGARVVLNISGPFSLLGRAVAEAALAEGCHYLDSAGEQDFMLELRDGLGARFEREQLLLSPSASFLWAAGTAAAEICLETPGLESLEAVYAPPSLQTVASLQSMIRVARRPGFDLVEHELHLMEPGGARRVLLPGATVPRGAVPIGGGEATFFMGDPRVRRFETLFASDELARAAPAMRLWGRLANWLPGETVDRWSDALVLRLKKNPPPEDPETGRFVVTVQGQGRGPGARVILRGTSPYSVTGFLLAMGAQSLLDGKAQRFGYSSLSQAFGARFVLRRLEEIGTLAAIETTTARAVLEGAGPPALAGDGGRG